MKDRELLIKFRVGIFVFALLLLFGAFVLTIGIQTRLFDERYPLRAAFRDIQGLIVGAPVRLAGLTVGTVQRVSFNPEDLADPRIHVEVAIDGRFKSRIREDSVATIGTVGLVGDKIFEISVGTEMARILEAGDHLKSTEPPDFSRLVSLGGEVLEEVTGASQALKAILGRVEKGEGLLGALLTEKTDPALLESLGRSAARLEEILQVVQEGDGLLHAVIYEEGGKTLVTGTKQAIDAGQEALQDLRVAAANLKQITTALAEGEGTLGALLQDPTVYEDLSSLLRGVERNWILRSLIRSSVRRGEDSASEEKK